LFNESNICHVIFYVLRCLIKENLVQYFFLWFQLIPSQTPEQFSKLPCSTAVPLQIWTKQSTSESVLKFVIFYVLRCLIKENLVQYF
jgi:hypothetical protein